MSQRKVPSSPVNKPRFNEPLEPQNARPATAAAAGDLARDDGSKAPRPAADLVAARSVEGSPAAAHRRESAGDKLRIAVLTVSDSRTLKDDTSGQLLVDRFTAAGHTIVDRVIVRDEVDEIRAVVQRVQAFNVDALLITGGTGVSPRDCTPEAVEPLLEVVLPGFGELFRMLSYAEIGAASMLSRAIAGRVGQVLVFCLPGSTAAVRLATDKLLLSDLPHLVHHSRG